jgi:hypothetical protein
MKWFRRRVVVELRRPRMEDERLATLLAAAPGDRVPAAGAVLEIADRMEEEYRSTAIAPRASDREKMDAVASMATLDDLRRQMAQWQDAGWRRLKGE